MKAPHKVHLTGYSAYTLCGRSRLKVRVSITQLSRAYPEEIPYLCKVCLKAIGKEVKA